MALSTVARAAMRRELLALCQARIAQTLTHEQYIDALGQLDRKYPGVGFEQVAMELDQVIQQRRAGAGRG